MKEWLWMDYPNENPKEETPQGQGGTQRGQLSENVEKIKDSEWDYYSGLPNPTWYENNNKQ